MKKEYVLGFVHCHDLTRGDSVLLINKNKPANQQGKLNGVGGHIEPGEVPLQAMMRECAEETGLQLTGWRMYGLLHHQSYLVYLFTVSVKEQLPLLQEVDEELLWYSTPMALVNRGQYCMHSIPALIAASLDEELPFLDVYYGTPAADKRLHYGNGLMHVNERRGTYEPSTAPFKANLNDYVIGQVITSSTKEQ